MSLEKFKEAIEIKIKRYDYLLKEYADYERYKCKCSKRMSLCHRCIALDLVRRDIFDLENSKTIN
jgi:hypothetical protein